MSDDFPNRQTVRLPQYDYSANGLYFITICTRNQENLFGKIVNGNMFLNETGKIVETEILNTAIIRQNIKIDQYIIMPNHIHLIIQIVGATRWVARNPDNTSSADANPDNANLEDVNPDNANLDNDHHDNNANNKTTLKSGTIGAIIGKIKSISSKKAQKKYRSMNVCGCGNDILHCNNDEVGQNNDEVDSNNDEIGYNKDEISRGNDEVMHNNHVIGSNNDEAGQNNHVIISNNDVIGRDDNEIRRNDSRIGRNICIGVGRPTGSPLRWQRNYHEHIIRDEKSYFMIVDYIRTNPLKWDNDKFYRD